MLRSWICRIVTYVGADGRQLRFQVLQEDGTAFDLSSYGSASVSATLNAEAKMAAKAVMIEGGTDGWINFTPTAAEIDTAGVYNAQVRLVDSSSKIDYTEPFEIEVKPVIYETGA